MFIKADRLSTVYVAELRRCRISSALVCFAVPASGVSAIPVLPIDLVRTRNSGQQERFGTHKSNLCQLQLRPCSTTVEMGIRRMHATAPGSTRQYGPVQSKTGDHRAHEPISQVENLAHPRLFILITDTTVQGSMSPSCAGSSCAADAGKH